MNEPDAFVISALPLLAVVVCGLLLAKSTEQPAITRITFLNLLIMSAAQALSFLSGQYSQELMFRFADIYLICGYFLFANLVVFVNSLSESRFERINYIYTLPLTLTILHILGFIVDGYRLQDGSPMHIDGALTFLADFFVIGCVVATSLIVYQNLKHNNIEVWISKNLLFLLSLVPLMLMFTFVILLSMTQYAISVVFVGPVITLYAAGTFFYLSRPRVVNIGYGFSLFLCRLKLAWSVLESDNSRNSYKALSTEIEKQFVAEALKQHDCSIVNTADFLGLDHSTLRKKLKQFHISVAGDVILY
ncbi:MAG: hypothetical protein HOC70_03930 [Gammaproteobacteria bacterium]|nr:hypothetical protein [Gammaproteobacteria bacterium]